MADKHTRTWITFFQNAGIQDVTLAARYAAIFVENEIRSSMLMELDMELLRVMGISKVGHVLGILKHAKHVHDTQLFAASQPSPPSRSHSSGTSSPIVMVEPTYIPKTNSKKNRSTGTLAASRIIEHYVKQPDTVAQPPHTPPPTPAAPTKKPRAKVADRLGSESRPTPAPRQPAPEYEAEPPVVKQRTRVTDRLGAKPPPKRKTEISFEAEEEEVPVVKRVRRVLPEHEGGYRIRMPSGTTPRSREILAKMSARHPMTVFDRLGDASVSSTTEVEEPTITITGFGTQIVKAGNSVFSRLGGRREATPALPQPAVQGVKARLGHQITYKATPTADSSIKLESRFQSETPPSSYAAKVAPPAAADSEVKYVGVLKRPTAKKTGANVQSRLGTKAKTVENAPSSTSAKRNSSAGILGNPTNSTKLSAKERLDLSARDTSIVTRPAKTRKFIMTNKKTGVQTIVYKLTDDDEPPQF